MTISPNFVPNPLNSDRQYARFSHHDLADSEGSELIEELWFIRPCLWGLPADAWLRERHQVLQGELRKRQWREAEYKARKILPKAEGVQL